MANSNSIATGAWKYCAIASCLTVAGATMCKALKVDDVAGIVYAVALVLIASVLQAEWFQVKS